MKSKRLPIRFAAALAILLPLFSAQAQQSSAPAPFYRDLNLLQRQGFFVAREAAVSVRVVDRNNLVPTSLQPSDFTLIVNGTPRSARLQSSMPAAPTIKPLVLIVFPPNQPEVHFIGVREARKYFSAQPNEQLPWRVALLDANGKLTAFTDGRSQLLAFLDVLAHTNEPFQYDHESALPVTFHWDGTWRAKAQEAVGLMQNDPAQKIIVTLNPLAESLYGQNDGIFAHDGPESLEPIAQQIGAHIYIANVGGPDTAIDTGAASANPAFDLSASSASPLVAQGTASAFYAFRSSLMRHTAADTLGGFSNSLIDLAGKIHRDLDQLYTLTFDLTAKDRDLGLPEVEVRLAPHDLRAMVAGIAPIGSTVPPARTLLSADAIQRVHRAAKHPVASADFAIHQRVDYFPLRAGLQTILPMTCLVEWKGAGASPRELLVLESVEDLTLSSNVLERSLQGIWNGRRIAWERDGVLQPGQYLWRVAVHDATGNVLSSVEQKITVDHPRNSSVAVSSLLTGKACRAPDPATQGLRRRTSSDQEQAHLQLDPMGIAGCRLDADTTDRFQTTDRLYAFLRLYPVQSLEKRAPESWSAHFLLRSAGGAIEAEEEKSFSVDAGSGYLAATQFPINGSKITLGPHTLEVLVRGPGIRGDLKESRALQIDAPPDGSLR